MRTRFDKLNTLFLETEALLQDNSIKVFDYHSLKLKTIDDELRNELQVLFTSLNEDPEHFAEYFKIRCHERAIRNAGSCLDFLATPQGKCNELYWQIAESVFEPKTLGEMFQILLPHIDSVLSYEPYLSLPKGTNPDSEEIKKAQKDPQIRLSIMPIAALTQKPCLDFLLHSASEGSMLFDLSSLEPFNLRLHQLLHNQLQQNYPKLASEIYHHSSRLKALKNHLLLINAEQTLFEHIERFARELRLGGEKMTGNVLASVNAQLACTDFFVFLESLPSELKEQLLLLKTSDRKRTFEDVMEHLKAGKCVEEAAVYLQSILGNSVNKTALQARPNLSQENYSLINRQYGKHNPLTTEGCDTTVLIPECYLESNLSSITIKNSYAYLSLLISIPPMFYSPLLRYAKISCKPSLRPLLGEMLTNGILNKEQVDAFNQAIVDNYRKLGRETVLNFAAKSKNYELITLLIANLAISGNLSNEDQVLLEYSVQSGDYDLFTAVISTIAGTNTLTDRLIVLYQVRPNTFFSTWNNIPIAARIEIIKPENNKPSFLHAVTTYCKEILPQILTDIPPDYCVAAVLEKNQFGNVIERIKKDLDLCFKVIRLLPDVARLSALQADTNLLHAIATENPGYFISFWSLLPEADQVLIAQNLDSQAFLFHTAQNLHCQAFLVHTIIESDPYILPALFLSLPELEREKVLHVTDYSNNRVLFCLADAAPPVLFDVLKTLPSSKLSTIFALKDRLDKSLIHKLCIHYPDILPAILSLLPENKRFEVMMLESRGVSHLNHVASTRAHVFLNVFSLLPESARFEAIAKNQKAGYSLLHTIAINRPQTVQYILLELPENQRLAALNQKDIWGKTALHFIAIKDPSALLPILRMLPEKERLAAVITANLYGETVLHIVDSKRDDILYEIVKLLPKSDRKEAVYCEDNSGETLFKRVKSKKLQFFKLLPEEKLSPHTSGFFRGNSQLTPVVDKSENRPVIQGT